MKSTRWIKVLAATLMIVIGIGLLLVPTLTDLRYALSQQALEAEAAANGSRAEAGGRPMPSGAVALLAIPDIDLKAYVGEGTGEDVLANGPGHYEETPLPGDHGNSAIAGHRTMHGHPFRRLDELDEGDRIVTYTTKRKATYRVTEVKNVDPGDVSVIEPTEDDRLTLTTCTPVGSARQRLVVVARLVK